MIVYEVDIAVDEEIADAYVGWLAVHVDEMLTLPGFVSAQRFRLLDPVTPGVVSLRVQYTLRDRKALDRYLRDHAPRMRAEGQQRFPTGVRLTRRLMCPERAG